MYVSLVYYPIHTLGPGIRAGLWTQGCSIKCKNCISQHTWYPLPKHKISIHTLSEIINSYPTDKLTISGGEPLDQAQQLIELLKLVKPTKKDILLYTGYNLREYKNKNPLIWEQLKNLVDVIIDGPFIWGLESELIWKGSENQKMYILNPKLKETYLEYKAKTKNKNLQLIYHEQELFLVGIPYQKDYYELTKLKFS
ncbi:MAG: 4Fe-4S single cluster domain-containing protein [bacterium]